MPGGISINVKRGRTVLMKALQDFKTFLLRGNAADLAVAFIIGAAFGAIVTALVKDLITPLISAIGANPDFSALQFTLNGSVFRYGDFLNTLISFIVIAAVVFFLIVRPMNAFLARSKKPAAPAPEVRTCPECLSEVPKAARRCKSCTSELKAI